MIMSIWRSLWWQPVAGETKTTVANSDRQRFRVLTADGSETLATANCVVSRSGDNIQGAVARVVWDLRGLACENW